MSSADNFCKQFRPKSDPTGMILIQTAWHSTDITEKKKKKQQQQKNSFWKKISADDKTMANYLVGKKGRWWKVLHVHAGFMLKPYICLL